MLVLVQTQESYKIKQPSLKRKHYILAVREGTRVIIPVTSLSVCVWITKGAFHSTKTFEISGPKLNGTVKIPGKVFENLGIRFECTLFDGISGIIENFVFHSQKMSGLVSLSSVGDTIRFPVCHTPKEQQYLFFWQNCGPPRWIASWIPPSVLYFLCQ